MDFESSADYGPVFAHFGAVDVAPRSCYRYAPVFPCRVAGERAVVKRTRVARETASAVAGWTRSLAAHGIPVVAPMALAVANPAPPTDAGPRHWVAYPFVDGRRYRGTDDEIAAAGDLLGRIHAHETTVTPPPFEWPDPDPASVREDQDGLKSVLGDRDPAAAEALSRLVARFPDTILPELRNARLPRVGAVMDFKANNLVYTPSGPVLVDPDNADYAPRLFDLALAALQFHIEHAEAPPAMFTEAQWRCFLSGYLRHVEPTDAERRLWPTAVDYVLSEFGVWSLIESDDWSDPREAAFLLDLAGASARRFPLSGA